MQDFEMTPPLQPSAAVPEHPEYAETEEDGDDERPASARQRSSRAREGLPPAYRMRHASHYVEQLMGDTPLQTVRHISIDQIDSLEPPDRPDAADELAELAASIRQVGILQPLLVTQGSGTRFDLLAGERRLAAARQVGLQAVPCLLVHADAGRASELRTQAAVVSSRRESEAPADLATPDAVPIPASASIPDAPPSAPAIQSPALELQLSTEDPDTSMRPARALDTALTTAVDEIGGALDFVTALMPAASAARSTFQQAVIADLIQVEKRRAAALTAAAASLTESAPLEPETFDWLEFTEALRANVALEARLRDVEVEWLRSLKLRPALADKRAMTTAWNAILHAALSVSTAGDRIGVALATPRIRPAIILTVSLHTQPRFTPATDEDQHGAGAFLGGPGELMLASARHSARRQGGRLTVATTADSLVVEFVVPQALAYWQ